MLRTSAIAAPPIERTSPSTTISRLRNNNFDLLRLIFASMVVVFHTGLLSNTPSLAWMHLYVSSTFAVQAFFVVSGFLVTMSYENSSSLASYAIKRFRRIAPAYVLVVVGAAMLLSLVSSLPAAQYFTDSGFWRYLGYNLMLSNFSVPSLPGVFQSNSETAVNGSLWTIKIEVAFYCFVPVMVWATRRYGYQSTLLSVFFLSLIWKSGFNQLALIDQNDLYARLAKQLPGQLAFFVGGAWSYYRTREGYAPPLAPCIISIFAYALSDGVVHELISPVAVTSIVWWLAIGAPIVGNVGKHGDFSYGIYLYHFPLIQVLVALHLFSNFPLAIASCLFASVVLVAILSWKYIEYPFLSHRALFHLTARPSK